MMRVPTIALIAGIALCVGIMGLLAVNPGEARIGDTTPDGAMVEFSASRRWVVRPGDCVTLNWHVEGIQQVYLDGAAQIGRGTHRLCLDETTQTATLKVVFRDETVREYALEVGFIGYAPEIWLLSGLSLMFLIALLIYIAAPLVARQPTLLAVARQARLIGRWAVLLLVSLVLAAVVFELGLRWYFGAYGSEAERIQYLYSDDQIRRISTRDALPYLNYGLAPAAGNPLGFRGPAVEIPKPAHVFRVVVLGDSTVYGLGVRADATFPAQLQQQLRRETGRETIEVINAGVSGYTTWHSAVNLAFRVLELEPDLIMIIHTVSEIGVRELNPDCYRGYTAFRGLNPIGSVLQLHDQVSSSSALARFVGINLGWMDAPDPDHNMEVLFDCVDAPRPAPAEAMTLNPPVYFERNLRSMISTAQGNGIAVLLTTWTYGAQISPESAPDWWKQAVAEHNGIIARLADEMGTDFFDLAATSLRDDPANWGGDYIHGSEQGYREQARLVAQAMMDTGVLDD